MNKKRLSVIAAALLINTPVFAGNRWIIEERSDPAGPHVFVHEAYIRSNEDPDVILYVFTLTSAGRTGYPDIQFIDNRDSAEEGVVRDSQPSITVNGRTFEAYIPSQEESVIYTQARQKDTNYLARLIAADTPVITFSMDAKHQAFTFDGKGGKKALGRYTPLPFGQD